MTNKFVFIFPKLCKLLKNIGNGQYWPLHLRILAKFLSVVHLETVLNDSLYFQRFRGFAQHLVHFKTSTQAFVERFFAVYRHIQNTLHDVIGVGKDNIEHCGLIYVNK